MARIKGKPQHEATANAAASPPAVSSAAPLPRAGGAVLGGLGEKFNGMGSFLDRRSGPILAVCSDYRLKHIRSRVMGHEDIAIGDISRRTGCNIETVRHYGRF